MTQKLDPVWQGRAQIGDALLQDRQQTVKLVLDKSKAGT
jgi:hypothetical protein